MTALPVVSGRETVKALEKFGYVFDRQRGSHMILRQRAHHTDAELYKEYNSVVRRDLNDPRLLVLAIHNDRS